jgi:hypothetical protein
MPTQYTDCHECSDLDLAELGINVYDTHKANIQKRDILFKQGIPEEMCQIILKKANTLTKCSFCNTKLCDHHTQRAKNNGQHYRHISCLMCDQCCWFEIG